MPSIYYSLVRMATGVLMLLLGALSLHAQTPVLKIDFNQNGRQLAEVHEPGYLSWYPATAVLLDTLEGVIMRFESTGAGDGLKSNWYKAGIQSPYYARLVSDVLTVNDGTAGAEITMTLSGLTAGQHSLLFYLNHVDNPATNTFAPVDIFIDGTQVADDVQPSERALSTADAYVSYHRFTATAGTDVTVVFRADTTFDVSNKNLALAGVELNTPNARQQARTPVPTDGDTHVDADQGGLSLAWSPAPSALSHALYFGTDEAAVTHATLDDGPYLGTLADTTYALSGLSPSETYYWRVDETDAEGIVTKGNTWSFRPRQLAFPGAEGYGRYARGGRGGQVVYVTNLDDSGPGSLREALTQDIGPRTVVFAVSGMIELESRLTINQSNITLAGQTAPGKGICLRSAPLGLSGASDVIIRHVRVRVGAGTTYDGMGMAGSNHSIIDHSSISWTIDESFSSRSAKNISLQRTLISEPLNIAGHVNYDSGTAHGYAASISGDIGSFHHNLLAHAEGRNWSLAGGLDGDNNFAGRLDLWNNVVYNWRSRTTDGGAHEVNFVNNYYKPGAATRIFTALNATYEDNFGGTQQYYFAGNVMPGYFDETNQEDGRQAVGEFAPPSYPAFVDDPFFPLDPTLQSATAAYKSVLSDVGCTQPVLDDHDIRIIQETLTGTYTYVGSVSGYPGLPDHQNDVGGYEDYPAETRAADWDSDLDGLPDWWETTQGLDPHSATGDFSDAHADPDGDEFTNLEDYLNWLAAPHYFMTDDETLALPLYPLFRGYTHSPQYTVIHTQNCRVRLHHGMAMIQSKKCGLASFTLAVTDADGDGMTRTIGLYVDGDHCTGCQTLQFKQTDTHEDGVLYPNPVRAGQPIYVKLAADVERFDIYSSTGQPVKSVPPSGASVALENGLRPGAYIVRVTATQGVKNFKLIVR